MSMAKNIKNHQRLLEKLMLLKVKNIKTFHIGIGNIV